MSRLCLSVPALLLSACLLSACGNKGDLYLPPPPQDADWEDEAWQDEAQDDVPDPEQIDLERDVDPVDPPAPPTDDR